MRSRRLSVTMPSKRLRAALAALLLVAAAAPAHAFRCGSRIITRGDPAEKILRYCGEPDAVTTRLKQRPYFGGPASSFAERSRRLLSRSGPTT
jgi:hypothetical protein